MLEWYGTDIMVQDMGFDDGMKEMSTYEAEITIDGCGGPTGKRPSCRAVVGKGGVCVLQVGYGY